MLHEHPAERTGSADPLKAFALGDYLTAARHLPPDRWEYWASLALNGKPKGVAEALDRFPEPEARFHAAVADWIDGDDDRALARLDRCQGEYARRLAALIRASPITVLAMWPSSRGGGSWDLLSHVSDPSFRVLNVSFHRDDIRNRPYADAREVVPAGVHPDMFVTEMLEWHLIPPNIRALGCPVIGHTSDADVHVQAVAQWLPVFDELLVLDHVEWAFMRGLTQAPVSVYSKVFGIPDGLPDIPSSTRDVDVFISGTVLHPYHWDKDEVVVQILGLPDVAVRLVNGFDAMGRYYRNLARSKVCVTYVRHSGGLGTRALEALSMGCVVAIQEENVLRLFADDRAGVIPFGPSSANLVDQLTTILGNWPDYCERARRGADIVRREFGLTKVVSQYLRFLTVVAARPREARPGPPPSTLVQKRSIVHKGWLPSYKFGGQLLRDWAAANARRIRAQDDAGSPRLLNDLSRELLLAHYHDTTECDPPWLSRVVAPLERAVARFPESLVPRLNLARVLLHFGGPANVRLGVSAIDDVLDRPVPAWRVDPLDDVLPWDFCPSVFNYRRYFDAATALLAHEGPSTELIDIILASLYHYRSRYAPDVHGPMDALGYARGAVRCDPDFSEYIIHLCRLLLERGRLQDVEEAAGHLKRLSRGSARVIEIADLARGLPPAMRGPWVDRVDRLALRFWDTAELREYLAEPPLRPISPASGVAV